MDWFILAPVPGPVEFNIGGFIAAVALLVAWVPVVLAVRDARSARFAERDRTHWRVLEGGKDLRQRAA